MPTEPCEGFKLNPLTFGKAARGFGKPKPLHYSESAMKKTCAYIDGGNLYYGILRHGHDKWLDLDAFLKRLLRTDHEIVCIKYFASRVIDKSPDHHKSERQDKYFDALRNRPNIEIVEGRYREQKELLAPVSAPCIECPDRRDDGRIKVVRITEKLTDVNIASAMLVDAFERKADAFVLVTGDSDLAPVVKAVRYRLGLPVLVFNPQRSICNELRRYATFYRNIDASAVAGCRLPDTFQTIDRSRLIHCPAAWR